MRGLKWLPIMFHHGAYFGDECRKINANMNAQSFYNKGLFFITYLLINTDHEISDDELMYLHKMRIEEGIDDDTFSEYFKSVLDYSEREVYRLGIEALNCCPDEYKIRAFERLFQMAYADKVLKPREIRFILYAIKLTHTNFEELLNPVSRQAIGA